MAVGAKITVTSNRNKGSIQGSKEETKGEKSIVKELKGLSKTLTNYFKKQMSFPGAGGSGTGAAAGRLLAGVGEGLVGVGALAAGVMIPGSESLPGTAGSSTSYEKLYDQKTGEIAVAETNRKTGEILNILTEQEAIQKGILDESGMLKNKYSDNTSKWDEINKQTDKWKDAYVVDIGDNYSEFIEKQKTLLETMDAHQKFLDEMNVEAGKLPGLYKAYADKVRTLKLPKFEDYADLSTEEAINKANDEGYFDSTPKGQSIFIGRN